eukprot:CCRYP_016347-RF/>CCRYP_016347-RF protein AED:0.49 eAED:1.00 QI:0/-1/0/1/-1/0/1/0/30
MNKREYKQSAGNSCGMAKQLTTPCSHHSAS